MGYADYEALAIEVAGGIATITLRFQGPDESTHRLQPIQHRELVHVWRELDAVGDESFRLGFGHCARPVPDLPQ